MSGFSVSNWTTTSISSKRWLISGMDRTMPSSRSVPVTGTYTCFAAAHRRRKASGLWNHSGTSEQGDRAFSDTGGHPWRRPICRPTSPGFASLAAESPRRVAAWRSVEQSGQGSLDDVVAELVERHRRELECELCSSAVLNLVAPFGGPAHRRPKGGQNLSPRMRETGREMHGYRTETGRKTSTPDNPR